MVVLDRSEIADAIDPSQNLPAGEKRTKAGWEDIWYYGFGGSCLLAIIVAAYRPDDTYDSPCSPRALSSRRHECRADKSIQNHNLGPHRGTHETRGGRHAAKVRAQGLGSSPRIDCIATTRSVRSCDALMICTTFWQTIEGLPTQTRAGLYGNPTVVAAGREVCGAGSCTSADFKLINGELDITQMGRTGHASMLGHRPEFDERCCANCFQRST